MHCDINPIGTQQNAIPAYMIFNELSPDTKYHFFARSKESDNYTVGSPSSSLQITTDKASQDDSGDSDSDSDGANTSGDKTSASGNADSPRTGDTTDALLFWTLLIAASGAALIVLALMRRRTQRQQPRGLHIKK